MATITIDSFDDEPVTIEAVKQNAPQPSKGGIINSLEQMDEWARSQDAPYVIQKMQGVADKARAWNRSKDALILEGLSSSVMEIPRAVGELGRHYTEFTDKYTGGPADDALSSAIRGGFKGLEQGSQRIGEEAAKFYRDYDSGAIDRESVQGKVFYGLGQIPASFVQWHPVMVGVNALNKVAEGDLSGAAKSVAMRAGLGKALSFLQSTPLGTLTRQAGASGLMGAASAIEGGNATDVAASAIMGGLIPIGGAKKTVDTVANMLSTIAEQYKKMIGIKQRTTPEGYGGLQKDIAGNVDAVLSTAERSKRIGEALPENRQEHLKALSERRQELYDSYAPIQAAAAETGAKVDLNIIADRLEALAENRVTRIENPQDAKWYKDHAAILRNEKEYSLAEADEVIHKNNEKLYDYEQAKDVPSTGSKATLKAYTDILRNELVNQVEGAGFDNYRALRKEYGIVADAQLEADARLRKELIKIDPNFFEGYQGALTGIEMLKFAAGQGHLASPGVAYAIKGILKKYTDIERGIRTMYKAADRVIEDSIKRTAPSKPLPANLISPKAAYGVIQGQDKEEQLSTPGVITIDSFD